MGGAETTHPSMPFQNPPGDDGQRHLSELTIDQAAEKLINIILSSDKKKGIAISGEMGAGKTHLVRELVSRIDSAAGGTVSSPTYAYRNQYKASGQNIHHYDLYRVRDEAILESIGFWESLEEPGAAVLVEWAELFPETLKHLHYKASIKIRSDRSRAYSIEEL